MKRPFFIGLALVLATLFSCDEGDGTDASPGADATVPDATVTDAAGTDANGSPDVVVVGMGEALVTWNAPTTRSDGASLAASAIGGYRVHYGTATRTYSMTVDVGATDNTRITGLTVGQTYYFAVTAYDTSDRESAFSEEATKVL